MNPNNPSYSPAVGKHRHIPMVELLEELAYRFQPLTVMADDSEVVQVLNFHGININTWKVAKMIYDGLNKLG